LLFWASRIVIPTERSGVERPIDVLFLFRESSVAVRRERYLKVHLVRTRLQQSSSEPAQRRSRLPGDSIARIKIPYFCNPVAKRNSDRRGMVQV
jgi:hypothetical protein